MGYGLWSGIGSGALEGGTAGFKIGAGNPYVTAAGTIVGAIGGGISGVESDRRNKKAEEYAAMEAGNARQQTLMELVKRKRQEQWRLQFGEALRNALLNRGGM